jgi:hypothetical protein
MNKRALTCFMLVLIGLSACSAMRESSPAPVPAPQQPVAENETMPEQSKIWGPLARLGERHGAKTECLATRELHPSIRSHGLMVGLLWKYT